MTTNLSQDDWTSRPQSSSVTHIPALFGGPFWYKFLRYLEKLKEFVLRVLRYFVLLKNINYILPWMHIIKGLCKLKVSICDKFNSINLPVILIYATFNLWVNSQPGSKWQEIQFPHTCTIQHKICDFILSTHNYSLLHIVLWYTYVSSIWQCMDSTIHW